LDEVADKGIFGFKSYLQDPSFYAKGIHNLNEAMNAVFQTGLPHFIDPSTASERVIFIASPYRFSSLEDRKNEKVVGNSPNAGAFDEDDAGSSVGTSSDNDTSNEWPIANRLSLEPDLLRSSSLYNEENLGHQDELPALLH
jgi:hypothetical protein